MRKSVTMFYVLYVIHNSNRFMLNRYQDKFSVIGLLYTSAMYHHETIYRGGEIPRRLPYDQANIDLPGYFPKYTLPLFIKMAADV